MSNRYRNIEAHADTGIGADDPEIHRFTRLSEQPSVQAATLARLEATAERARQRMEDTPRDHPQWGMVRDLAVAATDRADRYARRIEKENTPGQHRQAQTEGSHLTTEKEI